MTLTMTHNYLLFFSQRFSRALCLCISISSVILPAFVPVPVPVAAQSQAGRSGRSEVRVLSFAPKICSLGGGCILMITGENFLDP